MIVGYEGMTWSLVVFLIKRMLSWAGVRGGDLFMNFFVKQTFLGPPRQTGRF
jgi:hypothetical protein